MSNALSRLSGRGRRFIDKYVLGNTPAPNAGQPPMRPQTPAPVTRPVMTNTATVAQPMPQPLPPAPTRRPPSPVRPGAKMPPPPDQFANDSPDPSEVAPLSTAAPISMSGESSSFDGQQGASGSAEESHSGSTMSQPADPVPSLPQGYMTMPITLQRMANQSAEISSDAQPGPDGGGQPDNPAVRYTTLAELNNGADDNQFLLSSEEDSSSESESFVEEEPAPKQPVNRAVRQGADAGNTYMKTKQAPEKYDGEFNSASFRGNSPEQRNISNNVTRLYTEEEQNQNELIMNEKGAFTRGEGSVAGTTGVGYTMDATGRMVAFKEYERATVTTGPNGETRSEYRMGTPLGPNQRLETTHHTSVLGADEIKDADGNVVLGANGRPMMQSRPAAAAGTIDFNYMGEISKISNNSGHYAPTVEYLAQAIEHLMTQGAFFKDEVTDSAGLRLNPDSKEYVLYDGINKRLRDVDTLQARLTAVAKSFAKAEQKGRAEDMADLQKELDSVGAHLAELTKNVDKAKAVLQKLGIGPSRRVRDDATAEYIDIQPGMDPQQIKDASKRPQSDKVQDFLRSGGGNKVQADQKGKVLNELTRPFSKGTREAMEAVQAKLKDALTGEEASELEQLAKQAQAARAAEWADQDQQEKQRLRDALAQRRDELRDEASKEDLSKEDADELAALEQELQATPPAQQALAAPPLTDEQTKRVEELRAKLNSVLTKEDMAVFVARKKRAQVAGSIAAADADAETRTEKAGTSAAPDVDGTLRGLGIDRPEDILFNRVLPTVSDDDSSSEWSDSESEEDEASASESGEDGSAEIGSASHSH